MSAKRKRNEAEGGAAAEGSHEDAAEYQQGAIVRMKLHNFVTYCDVEFSPGPNLNVVIGPNGTGKSTIVCAICLGLAGKPQLLGRQKKVGEFIRSGYDAATIEIELHREGEANLVVFRTIRKDNTSSWKLNGKNSTEQKVLAAIRALSVQIDNLCQFLPQDKVPEFAKMDRFQLLVATEKAAGGEAMHKRHKELIELGIEKGQAQAKLEEGTDHLDKLRKQNQLLEPEVRRHEEREQQLSAINALTAKKKWAEYDETRSRYLEAKAEKEAARKEWNEAKKVDGPLQAQKDKLDAAFRTLKRDKCAAMDELQKTQVKLARSTEKVNQAGEDLEDITLNVKEHSKRLKLTEKKLERTEQVVEVARQKLEEARSPDEIRPELERVTARSAEISRQLTELQGRMSSVKSDVAPIGHKIRVIETELKNMESQKEKRMQYLRQRDVSTYKAVRWLRENQDKFSQTVYEPILLCIDFKEAEVATYLEAAMRYDDMSAFVCQSQADFEIFMKEVRDKQKLKVNVVTDPSPDCSVDSWQPKVPLDQLKQYGFKEYLVNMFTAPDPIKRYMCKFGGLHERPVGTEATEKVMDKLLRERTALTRFFTATNRCSVHVSKYGARKRSVTIDKMFDPRYLMGASDADMVKEKTNEVKQLKKDKQRLEDELQNLKAQEKVIRSDDASIAEEKGRLKTMEREQQVAKRALAQAERKVKNTKAQLREIQLEGQSHGKQRATILKSKLRQMKISADLMKSINVRLKAAAEISLQVVALQVQIDAVQLQLRENMARLSSLKTRVERAEVQSKTLKQAARDAQKDAKLATDTPTNEELSEAWHKTFSNYPDMLEEIDSMLHTEQAKLNCNTEIDQSVIKMYRETEKEIRSLEEKVEALDEGHDALVAKIEEVKKEWLGPLKELIAKINDSYGEFFERLNCAGEVELEEHETDFAQFGIVIKVKFRAEETLAVLTAHHQSGGERSVATMLYLMALQALTKVPFRVVDEINQGMDPNNERRVFSLVVHCSSNTSTSQYFLVTPKLLPNLEYNDKLRVLCVYNGRCLNVTNSGWNVDAFVENRLKRNRVA